jgi:hypothetical protein
VELVATNGSGSGRGLQVRFTTGVPSVSSAFEGTPTGATTETIGGEVNPAGQTTTYKVEYDLASSTWCTSFGASGSPANSTTPQTLPFTDASFHEVSVSLSGLTAGTSYCAELVATNGAGTGRGFQVFFTAGVPSAPTFGATATGATTATVEGNVNPAGQTTTYKVEYDLASSEWCTSFGSSGSPANSTTPQTLPFTDGTFHSVSVGLSGLTAGSEYCAELVATNGSGSGRGGQVSFAVGKSSQTITFTSTAPSSASVGGPTYTVAATASSGLAVSFTIDASSSSVCSISGATVSFIGAGTCTIDANQAGNSNYNAAPQVQQSFAAGTPTHSLTASLAGSGSGTVTGSGISCPGTCSQSYPSGTMVTLTATPASGSTFSGWSGGGCSGTGTCTVTMSSDQGVTATFVPTPTSVPTYSLTVSLAGAGSGSVAGTGISCPSTCSQSYPSGTMVTLTATPASGSTFSGWSGGGCSGTGTCAVTMSSEQGVTATFTANSGGSAGASAGQASASGTSASVPVSCAGPAGTTCVMTVTLSVTETLQGNKVLSVSSAKSKKPKKTKKLVIVGSASVTLAAGQSKTIQVKLNAAGQRLVKSRHKLSVKLTVDQSKSGRAVVISSQTVTFKAPSKKNKKKR